MTLEIIGTWRFIPKSANPLKESHYHYAIAEYNNNFNC